MSTEVAWCTPEASNAFPLPRKHSKGYSSCDDWRKWASPIHPSFYRGVIESVLATPSLWYGNCSTTNCNLPQRIVKLGENTIGVPLRSNQHAKNTHTHTHSLCKASSIVGDPSHKLFVPLPSGWPYRSNPYHQTVQQLLPLCCWVPQQTWG